MSDSGQPVSSQNTAINQLCLIAALILSLVVLSFLFFGERSSKPNPPARFTPPITVDAKPRWKAGSKVKVFGYICKTTEESDRVQKAVSNQDFTVITGLCAAGRAKQVLNSSR